MHKALSSVEFYKTMNNISSNYNIQKNLILEPFSCILKLIILQYKKEGTKISVSNNSILYCEPTFTQGVIRSLNGDCREDLHNLYHPLLKCVEWYSEKDPHFKFFYQECIKGIFLLKNVYDKNTTIHHTLNHYIDILRNNNSIDTTDEKYNPIIDKLQEMWSQGEIKTMYDLLMLIKNNKNKEIYIQALEDIVSAKEKIINNYIHQISTTY